MVAQSLSLSLSLSKNNKKQFCLSIYLTICLNITFLIYRIHLIRDNSEISFPYTIGQIWNLKIFCVFFFV